MNRRDRAKKETHEKLVMAAKEEFIEKGLLNISTIDVAQRAGVAHGTVFFHFENKENLLVEVLDRQLLTINDELYRLLQRSDDFIGLLNTYLDFLEREEEFFVIMARETPFYSPQLRRTIMGREALIRNHFYQALRKELEPRAYSRTDIGAVMNILFGTLNYYLSLRDHFISEGSVINKKRQALVNVLTKMIAEQDQG
jgi:AcrR family transcriptional regulator